MPGMDIGNNKVLQEQARICLAEAKVNAKKTLSELELKEKSIELMRRLEEVRKDSSY